jgi:hypothetical protein
MTPFDHIKAITETKTNTVLGTDNDELAQKSYEPFVVNRGLSLFIDTILHANEMNRLNHLDKVPQFSYLLNSIRPRKRYAKWVKKSSMDKEKLIATCYNVSLSKAKEYAKILTSDQVETMAQLLQKNEVSIKEKSNGSKH